MIGQTILITAVIDSCPSASGNEAVAPAPAKPREQKRVVGRLGDLVAQLPPALECVNHVRVQRHQAAWVFDRRPERLGATQRAERGGLQEGGQIFGWHAPHGKVTVLGQEPVTSRPGR
jgi:hypothetical protein